MRGCFTLRVKIGLCLNHDIYEITFLIYRTGYLIGTSIKMLGENKQPAIEWMLIHILVTEVSDMIYLLDIFIIEIHNSSMV